MVITDTRPVWVGTRVLRPRLVIASNKMRLSRGTVHGPVLDKVIDVGELGGIVLVSTKDLRQVIEAMVLGHIHGSAVVDVPDGQRMTRARTVQERAC